MKSGIKWHGLAELRRDLKTIAVDLTDDTDPIVERSANGSADAMRVSYPRRTGLLAGSVVVTRSKKAGATRAGYRVTNTAPYALWFEIGTRFSPPGRVFFPIRNQFQRAMYDAIKRGPLPKFNFKARGEAM